MRLEHALVKAIGATQKPAKQGGNLKGLDALKFALMSHAKFTTGEEHSTGKMRDWLAGRFRSKFADLAEKIKEACDDLVKAGLLQAADNESKPGRKVLWYKKVSWAEAQNGAAAGECARLDLQRDQFQ